MYIYYSHSATETINKIHEQEQGENLLEALEIHTENTQIYEKHRSILFYMFLNKRSRNQFGSEDRVFVD